MKFKYICTLLTLISALYFVTADAQTHKKVRKPVHRKAYHPKTKRRAAPPAKAQSSIAKSFSAKGTTVKIDTAKKGGPGGNSLSEEIVVTTAYKPILADAVKIRINPDLEDKTPYKAPLIYTPIDKRLELNSQIKQLDAMKRPPERDTTSANNYVKVGAGSMKTTFGEAYFDNGRDQALQVGGYLKHFAQQGDMHNEKSNHEQVGVFGKSIGDENSLSGKIDYDYRGNYFYGYNQFEPAPANLMAGKQHFSTISAEGEIAKNFKDVDNAFTYALKLNGYMYSDAYHAKESNIVLSGFLNETVGHFYAGVSSSLDLSTQQDSLYSMNNSIIRANPYLKFQGESYKIDAGINIVDQFGTSSAFNIFPAAKLEFQVIPKYVRLFVEAKGDVNKTSLLGFSLINPFLGQNLPIKNSVDQLDVAAGLKGTLGPGIGFKFTVFRNQVKDMPLFVSNFDFSKGYNRFTVIYDDGKSKVSGFKGELDFKASESLDVFGKVELTQYNMATAAHAWNLPQLKATAGAVIHISNKVNVTGTMLIRGSALDPYLTPLTPTVSEPTTIPSFVDISGEAEYKVTNKLSVFVHVNNLLDGSNQMWLYYPDYGFNIFGGVGYKF